jgi:hypothetical protein
MAKQLPIEIFMPPNMLKAKVGGTVVGLDSAALQRAEQAVEGLKTEFADWMADDVRKLMDARDGHAAMPGEVTQAKLFRVALDLKGQALTFGFRWRRASRTRCAFCWKAAICPAPSSSSRPMSRRSA